jgi:REP element-mobilizing transposase RayT
VRGFKIGVTKCIGKSIWQRNYYENIIRDDESYYRIANYIINNPEQGRL